MGDAQELDALVRHILRSKELEGNESLLLNVDGDGTIDIRDAISLGKLLTETFQLNIPEGQYLILPVSVDSAEGYFGVKDLPAAFGKNGSTANVLVFKNPALSDEALERRYANTGDIFGKLTQTDLEMRLTNDNTPETSTIRRWEQIPIDYRDNGSDYVFAGINHSQILREEALRLNRLVRKILFEDTSEPKVIVDYSTGESKAEITLYGADDNPETGKIWYNKYTGAENWARARAQRLLVSIALGNNIPEDYFPDERIAVEFPDRRVPDDFLNVYKAAYNVPKGFDLRVINEYDKKPVIYATGDEINSDVVFDIAVSYAHKVKEVSLEELVAGKETREHWSGERILNVGNAEQVDPGKYRASHVWLWPGPRRLRATAEYNDGTKRTTEQDLMVKTDKEPEYLKGAVLSTGAILPFINDDLDHYIYSTLNRIREMMGINLITLVPQWVVDDNTKTELYPEYGFLPNPQGLDMRVTMTDDEWRRIISQPREFDMKVMWKPHIRIKNGESLYSRWQGTLDPENDNWDALFESHLNFLLHYANLGKELGVEYYVIGSELQSMCRSDYWHGAVPDPDPRWRHIIDEVRKVYDGKLTLSLSSGQYGDFDRNVSKITWWDALDYIGYEPYFGLTGGEDPVNNGKNDPTLQELKEGFRYWTERALLPTVERYGKKVIITESNWYSFDGVNKDPLGTGTTGVGPDSDWKEQADCYNVLFDYFRRNNLLEALNIWAAGFIYADENLLLWNGSWDNRLSGAEDAKLGWLYGKPAEKVIGANWKK